MLSMVRSLLYRIVKLRIFAAFIVVILLCALFTPFMLWLNEVWPTFAATGIVELPDGPAPALQLYGFSLVGGSFLSSVICLMVGCLVAYDFNFDFVKNLVQAKGGRLSYVCAAMISAVVLTTIVVAAGTAVVALALFLQDIPLTPPEVGEAIQWFIQVVLCISAYASIAVFLGIATGSETVACIGGVIFGGGVIEAVLQMILANVPGLPVFIRDCLDGYLAADLDVLTQGIVCDPMTYVQAVVTLLVVGILTALVMRRRSLG
ncbi:hypothetical protein [Adlercreutzia sp. ZJ141]|uniref:hypothetical protein n=1 Tax=Adlercreutzia sp. ZJ141 TaxID=2709406 RepID=UPI0013EBFC17|nr:hypothetical protein [Adlercreutzia sp. ZJ141]